MGIEYFERPYKCGIDSRARIHFSGTEREVKEKLEELERKADKGLKLLSSPFQNNQFDFTIQPIRLLDFDSFFSRKVETEITVRARSSIFGISLESEVDVEVSCTSNEIFQQSARVGGKVGGLITAYQGIKLKRLPYQNINYLLEGG